MGNIVMNVTCPDCKSKMILKIKKVAGGSQAWIDHIIVENNFKEKKAAIANPYDQADKFV